MIINLVFNLILALESMDCKEYTNFGSCEQPLQVYYSLIIKEFDNNYVIIDQYMFMYSSKAPNISSALKDSVTILYPAHELYYDVCIIF